MLKRPLKRSNNNSNPLNQSLRNQNQFLQLMLWQKQTTLKKIKSLPWSIKKRLKIRNKINLMYHLQAGSRMHLAGDPLRNLILLPRKILISDKLRVIIAKLTLQLCQNLPLNQLLFKSLDLKFLKNLLLKVQITQEEGQLWMHSKCKYLREVQL